MFNRKTKFAARNSVDLEPDFTKDYMSSSSDSADSETNRVLNGFYLAEKR